MATHYESRFQTAIPKINGYKSGWFFGTEIDVLGGGNGSKGPKTYEKLGEEHTDLY